MPPARRRPKTKPAPKSRTKARARRSAPQLQLPKLEQRHYDVIGLGLVATAIFFAFVVYLDWDGGQAGDAAVDGLRVLIGAVHYLIPIGLMAAGAILVLRPVLPRPGYRLPKRILYERQRWFRRGRAWRAGGEARISRLKHVFGMKRSRYRGRHGLDRSIYWAAIANNLVAIGRHPRPPPSAACQLTCPASRPRPSCMHPERTTSCPGRRPTPARGCCPGT